MIGQIVKRYRWKGTQAVITVVASLMLCLTAPFLVRANDASSFAEKGNGEITECSLIMSAAGEVDAREMPDDLAAVVISYHDGDNIFITGETADGWYRVRYQNLTGYVRTEQVAEIELDVEALNDEFAIEEEEGKIVVEEVERQRTERRRSKIWGAVIIILVLGVFVTGIISTVQGGGKENETE